jgi:hypothetical protein
MNDGQSEHNWSQGIRMIDGQSEHNLSQGIRMNDGQSAQLVPRDQNELWTEWTQRAEGSEWIRDKVSPSSERDKNIQGLTTRGERDQNIWGQSEHNQRRGIRMNEDRVIITSTRDQMNERQSEHNSCPSVRYSIARIFLIFTPYSLHGLVICW